MQAKQQLPVVDTHSLIANPRFSVCFVSQTFGVWTLGKLVLDGAGTTPIPIK